MRQVALPLDFTILFHVCIAKLLGADWGDQSAREPDRTVTGPLDQARIKSRHSPAGRPHPHRSTNRRKGSKQACASQLMRQAWVG